MNKKQWGIIGIAGVLLVASGFASIGVEQEEDDQLQTLEHINPLSMILGDGTLSEEVVKDGNLQERILIVPIEGPIGPSNPTYNHELILAAADEVEKDPSIKAIIFKVNSGGGAVYHSREVYDRYMALKEAVDIPIYTSIGSVGASGAYYISMASDKIYAAPETITGSIGVILSSYNFSEFMQEHGISENTFKTGEYKDILSSSREMTNNEREIIQSQIDESFESFLTVVDQGRPNLNREEVKELASGLTYSGNKAKENGLVDEIGYFRDVVDAVQSDLGINDAQVFQYSITQSPFESMFGQFPFVEMNFTPDVKQLIKDIEDMQGLYVEYRMKGAGQYEHRAK